MNSIVNVLAGETENIIPKRSIMEFPLRNIGLLCCFFCLLKPSLFDGVEFVTLICRLVAVIIFVWVCNTFMQNGRRPSVGLVLFAIFRLSFLPATIWNQGDLMNWGYTTIDQVALFALIEWEMGSGKRRALDCLKCLQTLLIAYLVVNLTMVATGIAGRYVISEDGSITAWYLLGIRTRVTDCLFPALIISLIINSLEGRRVSISTILVLTVGITQVFLLEVSTALLGLAIFFVTYLVLNVMPASRSFFRSRNIIFLGFIACILVVVVGVQGYIGSLLNLAFSKEATLTGRTFVWTSAVRIIAVSPIFGYGINDRFGAFAQWRGTTWQAHNEYLQLLYDGGLIALVLFALFVIQSFRSLDRCGKDSTLSYPLKAGLLAFMVMMVSEIFTYNMGLFYLVPFIASGLEVFLSVEGASEISV